MDGCSSSVGNGVAWSQAHALGRVRQVDAAQGVKMQSLGMSVDGAARRRHVEGVGRPVTLASRYPSGCDRSPRS